MTLKAEETLEMTLTLAVMDSYSAAHSVLSDVLLTASEPQSLEEVILSDGELNPGGEALYWLQNLTDMPLEFWTRGPGQGDRALPIAFKPSDLGEHNLDVSCHAGLPGWAVCRGPQTHVISKYAQESQCCALKTCTGLQHGLRCS